MPKSSWRRRWSSVCQTAFLAFLAWVFLAGSLFHETIGPRVYDALMKVRSGEAEHRDAVLLLVKEPQDELWLNRRFWPRSIYGRAIDRLRHLGARAVGVDLLLRGASPSDGEDLALHRVLRGDDRTVLASCFGHGSAPGGVASLEEPASLFRGEARATGVINVQTTGRSMVRSLPLALKLDGRPLERDGRGARGELVPAFALNLAFVATEVTSVDHLLAGEAGPAAWTETWRRLFDELRRRGAGSTDLHPEDALEGEGIFPLLEEALASTPRLRPPPGAHLSPWLAALPSVELLRRREQARLLVRRLVGKKHGKGEEDWWQDLAESSLLVDRLVALQGELPPDPPGTPGGVDAFSRLRLDFEGAPGELFRRLGFREICRDRDYREGFLDPVAPAGSLDAVSRSVRGRILVRSPRGGDASVLELRVAGPGLGRVVLVVVHLESGLWASSDDGRVEARGFPPGELRWYAWSHGPAGARRAEGALSHDGRSGMRELDFGEGRVCAAWKPGPVRKIELTAHDDRGRPSDVDPVRSVEVIDVDSGHRIRATGAGSFGASEGFPAGRALILARTRAGRAGIFTPSRHGVCGAVVLLGSALRYEQDFYPVPSGGGTGQEMAGVAIQGQAVSNLLGEGGIRSPDRRVVLPATVGLFLLLAAASVWFSFPVLVVAWTVGIGLPLVLSAHLMLVRRTWFDPEGAATLMLCGFVAFVVRRVFVEQREARRRKAIFGKFVNPHVVDRILAQDAVVLDGERREVTVLFSDIRSFTTISEELEPGDVSRMLNEYFNRMTPVLLRHEGTFDKFIGDAVMGFFGAPVIHADHPLMAVRAAWEMLHENRKLQREWEERTDVPWPTFRIGFGLATGICQVGLIGSRDVANYTVLGDTVNLAARLESLNSKMGTELLISAATYERVREHVVARKVEKVDVKGKKEPVDVYQVLEVEDLPRGAE